MPSVTIKPEDQARAAGGDPGEAWLELAMRAADMGGLSWDLESDRFYVSDRAAAILGVQPGTVKAERGERLFTYTHPEDLERVRRCILDAASSGASYKIEHRSLRPGGGPPIWVLSAGTPVRDSRGKVTKVLGVVQDITEQKTEESHRETLMAELDHRVKNVLASVQSMALQSARKAVSLDGFMNTFAGRLKAMASAHTLLATARWQGAEIRHIVTAELGGLAPSQTHWEGPEIVLTPRATNALTLALHELATNAVKFGALSTEAGRVDVRWRPNRDGGFDLEWVESGGPRVSRPDRQGFGATLLSRVTGRELGGEARLDFDAQGVRARLTSDASAVFAEEASADQPMGRPEAQAREELEPIDNSTATASLAGLKVLIVEDSLLLSLELENSLGEAGAKVVGQAAEVPEALAMIGEGGVDAAILDADLNGEPVTPVAEALTSLGIPFVFATGYGEKQMAPQGFDAPYVRKPYDLTQLATALARATHRA